MSRQDIQIKVKTNPPEKKLHLLKVPFQIILQFFSERYSGKAELHYEEGCVLLVLKVTTEVEGQLRADILSNSLSTALRQLIIENVDDESHDDLELTCEELDVKTTPSFQVEMKSEVAPGDNRKVAVKTEKRKRHAIVKTEPDSESDSNEEKPSGTSSKTKSKEVKRQSSSGVKTGKIETKTIVKTEPEVTPYITISDSESDSNEETPAGTSSRKKTREMKGEFSSNRDGVVKTDVKTESDSESDSNKEQPAGTSSEKEIKAGKHKDSFRDDRTRKVMKTERGHSDKYPFLRAKVEETFEKNFSMIETCRIEVISIPDYDDNDGGDDDNDSDDDNHDGIVKGTVARGSLVAVFVFHDLVGNERIDSYVPLYLFKQTYNFSEGSFYELEKCLLSKDKEVRLLVPPETKISRISKRKIKNLRQETFNFSSKDYDPYQRTIPLPKVTVCEAKHCYLSYDAICSIRGVIHDIRRVEDHISRRTNFRLSDDEHDFITIVVPEEFIPEEEFLERDVLELTYLRTMSSDLETNYLLSTKHTEIKHVRDADDNLSRIRNSDAFYSFTSLKGIVVKCSREEEYLSCPNCYQKKLFPQEKGTYHCKRCKNILAKGDSKICYKVHLEIEDTLNKKEHAGIIFKDEVEKILSSAYQEIPQKGQIEALGELLMEKVVNVSMKICEPPLANVFSNFTIL